MDTIDASMMEGDTNYVYGVWGPYTNSIDSIVEFVGSHNKVGYMSICDDGNEGRWIIIQSTNTAYIAQGPFKFDMDQMVMNEENRITGVILGQENLTIEIRGLGKPYFDVFGEGQFWVISRLCDSNEGQSFCRPPTIPSTCDIRVVEAGIDLALGSHIPEVKGHVFEALVEEGMDTMMLESGTLCEGGTNNKIGELESCHLVDFVGDGTNLGAIDGHEGLAPLMPIACLEIGDGGTISEQDGVPLCVGESASLEPLPNDVDTNVDDIFAMFGDFLESGQASNYELEGQETMEAIVVSSSNLEDNNNLSRKRPWMDEPTCVTFVEVNDGIMEATSTFEPIVGNGANSGELTMPKKARMAKPPSPRSIFRLNASRGATSSNEVDSFGTSSTGSNGNEDRASSIFGDLVEILDGDAQYPLFDQGMSSSTESQWMTSLENVEGISTNEEVEDQMVEGTVSTTSLNSEGCKPSKKRVKQSKFKQHGVKRREGGRQSFVAYFRPKDLPESNKTFLTIGEFSNEKEAWNAFNLFAFVHEGEESCKDMEDRDSIEMEAAVWGELPRVDLLAHLRLKGRGYFRSEVLPPNSSIPRYRNIKFRKNSRGIDKGKIRWFCDVPLAEGVMDPYVDNGKKDTSTYETVEEAAKEADRLSMLNEKHMAWTNYTLTDYMTEAEKDQWDPSWIPLQDNPKKYLSTAKYNSLD